MSGKKRRRGRSISQLTKLAVLLLFPLLLLDVTVSLVTIAYIRSETKQYLGNMADLYASRINDQFTNINRRMLTILLGNQGTDRDTNRYIETIEKSSDQVEINAAIHSLQLKFNDYLLEYGDYYNFFLYFEDKETYVPCSSAISYEERKRIQEKIVSLITSDTIQTSSISQTWNIIAVDRKNYLVKLYQYNDKYIGSWISAEDLLRPLKQLDLGKTGHAVLTDEANTPLTAIDSTAGLPGLLRGRDPARLGGLLFSNDLVLDRPFSSAPFRIRLFISNFGLFEKVLVIQLLLFLLSLLTLITLPFMSVYLRRNVLDPVRRFSRNLENYEKGESGYGAEDSKIAELEQASVQFATLAERVKTLKIEVYEKELEKQRVQMDYMQLQIKPHFFLNCLNFIYHMAGLKLYPEIRTMAKTTSDYLRYLFRSNLDFVQVQDEMEHVKNYLDIQKMRYKSALTFYLEQDPETRNCLIPPLVIQSFVENAVKHTVSLDESVEISVTVFPEEREGRAYAAIFIADTGYGFDENTLALLQKGEIKAGDGSRIGIANCLARLDYFYGGEAEVVFYNSPMRGAVVEIHIPIKEREDPE
ncbi:MULTISPECIES: histidine kinase [unclassified Paenibacillus]|nr:MULTISPECIES: histidine kinase [unclassified Paenibacillus]MDF9843163.1 two-component system sensor histidine kinase YesM [Paenibacillus sp. PastF-2]MDF9849625.1 two-component system sensor histidine kinase YesM [Paenibacillus sp. PastM-2]MDF9856458.1 two-component system sensor histidine kinase YesM [Paenibacillus sp. PastF-1]MDH6509010.1 two-component system sensor histidine kinase YesM [Paenibacillus sp. PastM-3]